jgi:hypothetical protein
MVAHTCDLSIQEVEVGESQICGQPGLHSNILSQKSKLTTNQITGLGVLAHACNSNYLASKDCEDHSLKLVWPKG